MRLLLVEDERRLVETLRRGLEGEGYVVDIAMDGERGLRLAQVEHYDVIVLDVMLPRLSGYQICRRLRLDGNSTPILMLTAKDGEYDQAEGLDLGADDYLTKPFSYVVLTARLRALVRRGRSATPAALTVGDLTLDPARRRCARAGAAVALTAKEFAVLEVLMTRRDHVVAKHEILDSVWDCNDDRPDNLVEVYISTLRRKIDVPFGRSSIRTVRGMGYQLLRDDGPQA